MLFLSQALAIYKNINLEKTNTEHESEVDMLDEYQTQQDSDNKT